MSSENSNSLARGSWMSAYNLLYPAYERISSSYNYLWGQLPVAISGNRFPNLPKFWNTPVVAIKMTQLDGILHVLKEATVLAKSNNGVSYYCMGGQYNLVVSSSSDVNTMFTNRDWI